MPDLRPKRPRRILLITSLAVLPLAVFGLYVACSQETPGFRGVTPETALSFPRDHAAHPEYKNEWWYYTGHLKSEDGRRFGFQLTWFRVGLDPEEQQQSKFRSGTFYFAHFTVTDKDRGTFYHAELTSRGGEFDEAGADPNVLRTWIEDWRLEMLGEMFYLSAQTDTARLSLIATPKKALVLQGESGYSRKGEDPTNASMYYSYTRLGVAGVLDVEGIPLRVDGEAWMDHEFGTSQLGEGVVGWDWFSLQLSNGEELMLYGLRRPDGTFTPTAVGAYVASDGAKKSLAPADYRIDVLDRWRSPESGAEYPSRWRIAVPSTGIDIEVVPYVEAQELRTENSARVTYWEGAVRIEGTKAGTPITGEGYVELTGYAAPLTALQ